jgi:ribosomal protein L15
LNPATLKVIANVSELAACNRKIHDKLLVIILDKNSLTKVIANGESAANCSIHDLKLIMDRNSLTKVIAKGKFSGRSTNT